MSRQAAVIVSSIIAVFSIEFRSRQQYKKVNIHRKRGRYILLLQLDCTTFLQQALAVWVLYSRQFFLPVTTTLFHFRLIARKYYHLVFKERDKRLLLLLRISNLFFCLTILRYLMSGWNLPNSAYRPSEALSL